LIVTNTAPELPVAGLTRHEAQVWVVADFTELSPRVAVTIWVPPIIDRSETGLIRVPIALFEKVWVILMLNYLESMHFYSNTVIGEATNTPPLTVRFSSEAWIKTLSGLD
jgi:hypothetical protein